MSVILIHGGCSSRDISEEEKEQWKRGLFQAGYESFELLRGGNSSVDAVERAVRVMEDNPVYDAGTGSYFNILGEIEMDAMIMDSTGRTGGVIGIRHVRNPVSVARKVMEEIPHVLLSGEGAIRFARIMGFPEYDPGTEKAQEFLESQLGKAPNSIENLLIRCRGDCGAAEDYSTVGAAAIDEKGILTAATSTGDTAQVAGESWRLCDCWSRNLCQRAHRRICHRDGRRNSQAWGHSTNIPAGRRWHVG